MEDLLKNAEEFIDSGEENLKKERYNASVSDFFKAIVIYSDYLIYNQIKVLSKNHNERFNLLNKYFPEIYLKISDLFKTYTRSYNLRLTNKDALEVKEYAYKLRSNTINKK